MHLLFDTTPLRSGHAHRGIGVYTSSLLVELKKIPELEISLDRHQAKSKKIDIVHYPYFDLFFHTLPILKPAPRCVVTIHDVIPLQFKEYYPVGKKGMVAFYAQRLALNSVNTIVTNSLHSQKSIAAKLKIPEKKIKPIYLAGNPHISHQRQDVVEKFKAHYQLPEKYILYVGDINYNKNIPQLIKSLKYLDSNIHLVLFGKNFYPHDIPEWQWIETQLALSDVSPRVRFLTSLENDSKELSALYSGASVYVQPSLAEGFGIPIIEALQCKVPVVSSNTTALPEVGGSHVRYSDPTAEALAEAIEAQLALSPAAREAQAKDGYTWAKSFSWKKVAEETFDVYKTLI